jgi:hypothetical protein
VRRSTRGRRRLAHALIASTLLHGGAIGLFWLNAARGAEVEPLRVYAVNIVSPPPRTAGPPAPERAAPEDRPAPTPQPQTPQPEPRPEPQPPTAAPPRPAPQPEQPRPAPPREQPAPAPPRQAEPSPQQRPTTPPQPTPPREAPRAASSTTPPQPRAPAPPREAERAERTAPSSGSSPSPTSTGGENLTIRTEGENCPVPEFCDRVTRQVKRYFRQPPGTANDRGDVCFRIGRDGSMTEIAVERLRGSSLFQMAIAEAAEQAASRGEIGALPRGFGSDSRRFCVAFSPDV